MNSTLGRVELLHCTVLWSQERALKVSEAYSDDTLDFLFLHGTQATAAMCLRDELVRLMGGSGEGVFFFLLLELPA
jgi:hypothetical protein